MTKRTVLLIEDNSQNAYLVTYLLAAAGFQVLPANDGPAGIERARTLGIDLILLDIQLPGMDGYLEKPIDPQTFAATISKYLPPYDRDAPA